MPHGHTAAWELAGRRGRFPSSEWLCSLLDVFEKRGPGVHHRFEGIFAAGSHTLIGVEQHGQLPIGFVHFIPRRYNKSEGTHTTHSPAQPWPGWQSTAGPGAPPGPNSPFEPFPHRHQGSPGFGGDAMEKELHAAKHTGHFLVWHEQRSGENPSPGADTPVPFHRGTVPARMIPSCQARARDTCRGVPSLWHQREQKAGRQRGGTRTLTQLHIKPPTHSGQRHCTSLQPFKPWVSGPKQTSRLQLQAAERGGHLLREASPSMLAITAQTALQSC